jgi:lysophospholipase L1-like esterase
MKSSTLNTRIKKDWSPVLQSILLPLAFVVGVASFVFVANGKQTTRAPKAPPEAPPSILMVGDSLSVGKFGEVVQGHLEKKYAVTAYASCGSSPEHWLREEPNFYTKCGYRQHTANSDVFIDFVNGRAPRPTLTPKLESLIEKHKPTVVIVQLGTNWMDRSLTEPQMESYLHRFIKAARRTPVKKIIWITPPDSYRFRNVQGKVRQLIRRVAAGDDVAIVESRTHYKMGKTGSDGIHYNGEASQEWAQQIQKDLDLKISPPVPSRRLSKFTQDESPGASAQ